MKVIGEPGPGKGVVFFQAMTACDCGCGRKARFEFRVGRDTVAVDDPDHINQIIQEMNKGFRLLFPEFFMIALIDAINEARMDHKLNPVKQEPRLMGMASEWSIYMDEVYHAESHDHFQARLQSALAGSFAGGECVAQGQLDSEKVVEMWLEDPPHRDILLGDFDAIGVGQSGTFWCADLARLEP